MYGSVMKRYLAIKRNIAICDNMDNLKGTIIVSELNQRKTIIIWSFIYIYEIYKQTNQHHK